MKERLRKLIGIPLILIILVVVLLLGIRSGEFHSAPAILREAGARCLLSCVTCFAAYLVVDALGIHSALKRQGYALPFRDTFMVSLRGQYYYYITPSASGGQPMQIYFLHQLGVPTGVGTSVLVSHFAAFQSMLAVLTLVFGIIYAPFLREHVAGHFLLLTVGFIINAGLAIVMLLFSFFRKPVALMIDGVTAVARRLRLSRNPDALRARLQDTANLFHDSMELMLRHPWEIVRQLVLGGIQQLLLMSVLYCIAIGLGESTASFPQLLALGLAQYTSASYVPIPGASGAQEGVFSLFFRQIFPGASCYAAMLLWRGTTFYLPLLVSAAANLLYRPHQKK